jgi:peptidoglycan-associated lipoprotein
MASTAAPAPAPMSCATDAQCSSDQLCVDGSCTAITASMSACSTTRVHFDFDQALLHEADYPSLQRAARCIEALRPSHVLVTGDCDERGTVEYNLALGQRRAAAVSQYLATLGVPKEHLQRVSYGKEEPICQEHDEACWQQNRRAAIRPGATPMDIVARIQADEARERKAGAKARVATGEKKEARAKGTP